MIPSWMKTEEEYKPLKDREGFFTKTLLGFMSLLGRFRLNSAARLSKVSPALSLATGLFLIILMSLSRNMFFTYCILTTLLLHCCLLPTEALKQVLRTGLSAFLIAALFLLPSLFFGNSNTLLTVGIKVFASVVILQIRSATIPWNRITETLRKVRVPAIFILTIDLTLQYIHLLGKISSDMLIALKLRSLGKNKQKGITFSGVAGNTLLKTKEYADEAYMAMICRGFTGEYNPTGQKYHSDRLYNLLYVLFGIASLILFLYLEKII